MRLDKLLAHEGYGSRKIVKDIIRKGNVLVNGEIIKDDDFKVDENIDEITVFDETIDFKEYVYIVLNKPSGYVSATYDPIQDTVIDLVSEYAHYNIFPVGRLDIDTTGLLLLTNNGMLAHKMLSPKNHVTKKYYVKYSGSLAKNYETILKEGIVLEDGTVCASSYLEMISDNEAYITITEGKYHQVKRMFKMLGACVIELKRVNFGPLELKDLPIGSYYELKDSDLNILKEYL